jgi:hypothetical protein
MLHAWLNMVDREEIYIPSFLHYAEEWADIPYPFMDICSTSSLLEWLTKREDNSMPWLARIPEENERWINTMPGYRDISII